MCSEFKCQTVGFPGTNSWTILSVSMLMSLYTCRSVSPESLSTHIVADIDTKTVTTAKTQHHLSACTQSCDICLYFDKTIV